MQGGSILEIVGAIAAIITTIIAICQIVFSYRIKKRSIQLKLDNWEKIRFGDNKIGLKNYSGNVLTIISVSASNNIQVNTNFKDCIIEENDIVFLSFTLKQTTVDVKKSFIDMTIQMINGERNTIRINVSHVNESPKLKSRWV